MNLPGHNTTSAKDAYASDYNRSSISAVKETPFIRLQGAVERLRKASSVVGNVAGKLCGEQTAEASDRPARGPIGSGMLGSIEELADSISDMADDITEATTRIDRRL